MKWEAEGWWKASKKTIVYVSIILCAVTVIPLYAAVETLKDIKEVAKEIAGE